MPHQLAPTNPPFYNVGTMVLNVIGRHINSFENNSRATFSTRPIFIWFWPSQGRLIQYWSVPHLTHLVQDLKPVLNVYFIIFHNPYSSVLLPFLLFSLLKLLWGHFMLETLSKFTISWLRGQSFKFFWNLDECVCVNYLLESCLNTLDP